MHKLLLAIINVLIFSSYISAQTFDGYATAGGVVSQIDGDRLGGYNKIGLTLGLGIKREFSPEWAGRLEIGYIQKGKGTFNESDGSTYKTALHYMEIPVLAQYTLTPQWSIESGLSLAYLLSYKFYDNGSETSTYPYTPHAIDLNWILGGNYNINEQWQLNLQFAHSIIAIADTTPDDVEVTNRWQNPWKKYNRSMSLKLRYYF